MWTKIGVVAAVLAVLITLTGSFIKYHAKFAMAEEVYKVSYEFQYYKLDNRQSLLQQRMWALEDRYKCKEGEENKMPQASKEEYRKLKAEREKILKQMEKMERKEVKK